MTRVILMLIFFVLCNTGGELAMSYGVKQVGEPESFRPMASVAIYLGGGTEQLAVGGAAAARGFVLFAADFVFLGAGQRGDSGVGFQLHRGHVWREVSVEGRCFVQEMAGRDFGVRWRDGGFAYWPSLKRYSLATPPPPVFEK